MSKNSKVVLQSFLLIDNKLKEQFKGFLATPTKTEADNSAFTPKEEDYIRVPFRLLSAHIVGAGTWKATDFSDEAVLKASMPMLLGKPAYINHDIWDVNNSIGIIESVEWSEKDGDVPAGINGVYRIDAVANTNLARKVLGDEIQGSSVTIDYEYMPSHEFEEEWKFESRIGEMIDGKMVCRKVTGILNYYESSLVGFPADPFAKKLDPEGNPMNAPKSGTYNFAEERAESVKQGKYYVIENFGTEPEPDTQPKVETSELQLAIAGLQKELSDSIEVAKAFQLQLAASSATIEAQKTQIAELDSKIQELYVFKESYSKMIDLKRAEIRKAYTLSIETPSQAMITLIDTADNDTLNGLLETFSLKLNETLKPHCKKCGSGEISFQSSEDKPVEETGKSPKTKNNLLNIFRF
jgi:hypothetical protein